MEQVTMEFDQDQEIPFEGSEEGKETVDLAVEPEAAAPEPEEEPEDVLDSIVPKSEPKVWVIGPDDFQRTYIQKPMSFIAKMQWFSLVGEVLDKALSGPNAMSLNSLLQAPGGPRGAITLDALRDADTFVQAVGKMLSVAPDFLVDSYCLWLNVPDYERSDVKALMKLPPDEGGLTDDQGIEIIEVFIDQNWDELSSFFGEKMQTLGRRVQKKMRDRKSRR